MNWVDDDWDVMGWEKIVFDFVELCGVIVFNLIFLMVDVCYVFVFDRFDCGVGGFWIFYISVMILV